jgi:RNA polymerase sigma-70 factor (ECF subfamily)
MESKLLLLLNKDFASLNKSSQEEVYRDFYYLVYAIAMYMTKDHAAAEDIVQDAFLKTIYKAPPMENEQQLRAWIKVVTKNLTLNMLRKNKKIRNQEDFESVAISEENKYTEPVEKEVEINMLEENINDSLTEINPDYQKLIELKWKKDSSNKDIADQLGTTEGAIKQKLHRARQALKKKLRQKWGFQDE